jgi:hypothetical protein
MIETIRNLQSPAPNNYAEDFPWILRKKQKRSEKQDAHMKKKFPHIFVAIGAVSKFKIPRIAKNFLGIG